MGLMMGYAHRTAFGAAVVTAAIALATSAEAQPYGPGYGMMGGYGPGYGMMQGYGPGYGPGMGYGPGYGAPGNLNLSTDDVRDYFARLIAAEGNSHLKVGDVKEQGPDAIVADIVTQDNSLVQEFVVNRHTGFYHPEQASATNPTKPTNPKSPTKPTTQPNQK
jgi:hypothetical protein